ncbi:SOS response-associated peptidase [Pedobacter paludis]|uniref:SOS response-associated peptidase n=1 Tax=Pedobacter paludis TaxID=2203212 RepID=UPI0013149867|nr:SOS response-associated peptidase family protein [Pedobacter paludis]
MTRSEFIQLKQLEKAVRNYDFLNVEVHNGFNYPLCAIAVATDDKRDFELIQAQWGYVPGKMGTDEAIAFRRKLTTLNFKGENLFVSESGKPSMWRNAARENRCLVFSTGIIESQHIPKLGKKGQELKATTKYPHLVGLKGHEYFWMPGLYSDWVNQDTGEVTRTFAIGITQANELMKQVHNSKLRMPCILPDNLAWEWLMGDLTDDRITEIAMTQIPSRMLEECTIGAEYRLDGIINKQQYDELPRIKQESIDSEILDFDHWPKEI